MADVREALADNVAEVLMFLGFALFFLGASVDVEPVFALGIVTFFAAIFLSDPIEALLRADEETSGDEEATDPLEALRDRYARGEIDEAEFERRLDRLLETEEYDRGTVEGRRERATELE